MVNRGSRQGEGRMWALGCVAQLNNNRGVV